MLKKQKKKWLAILTLSCSLFFSVAVIATSSVGAENYNGSIKLAYELKTSYLYGDSVTVPDGKISYQGVEIDATEAYVITPDGTARSNESLTLNQVGTYTIVYSAEHEGKTVKAEKTFIVNKETYTVSSENSSVGYMEELPLKTAINDKRVEVYGKEFFSDTAGVHLALAQGDTFTYNKPINLNQNEGKLDFITLYHWQFNTLMEGWSSAYEATDIYCRLTDCYNPEIYVDYLMHWQSSGPKLYFRVNSFEQSSIGLNSSSNSVNNAKNKVVYLDGMNYAVYAGTFGANSNSTQALSYAKQYGTTFTWEQSTKKAYVTDAKNITGLINDLDTTLLFEEEELFKGFTTGEVYLSIRGDNYVSDTLHLDISSLGGISGNALHFETVTDATVPTVTIEGDLDSYGDIKIAYGEEYRIPNASAIDVNLVGEVKTALYLDYGTSSQRRISAAGGKFTPMREAKYTVEYSAKDTYGNTAVKTLDLLCVKTQSGKGIDLTVEKLSSLYAGKETIMPDYTAVGLNKTPEVNVSYICFDDENNRLDSGEIVGGKFVPYYEGTYRIVYEYTDGIKNYEYSYEVFCNKSDSVATMNMPIVPKYVLKGYTYAFDKFYVYTFEKGTPNAQLANLEVSFDGGEFVAADYDATQISANQSVKIRYSYQSWKSAVYEITLVDVGLNGALKMENLFYGDFQKSSAMEYVTYQANGTGNVSMDFVNPISISNFNFKYDIPAGCDNFEALTITLTDYYDESNIVNLRYFKNSTGQVVFSVNGLEKALQSYELSGVVRNAFYTAANREFTDTNAGDVKYPVKFQSDKATMTVTLENVTGKSIINVREINNQSLTSLPVDTALPQFTIDKVESGICELNSIITVYSASIIDVIAPLTNANLSVTVQGPDKKIIKDINGFEINGLSFTQESFTFKTECSGVYIIRYAYGDQAGNTTIKDYRVTVLDQNAPAITLNKKTVSAKVGDEIKFADYSVVDDSTDSDKLVSFICLLTPKGEMVKMAEESNAFKATYAGVWTVYYMAVDEAGNLATASYEITVK